MHDPNWSSHVQYSLSKERTLLIDRFLFIGVVSPLSFLLYIPKKIAHLHWDIFFFFFNSIAGGGEIWILYVSVGNTKRCQLSYKALVNTKIYLCWRLLVIYSSCYHPLHLEYFSKQYKKGFSFDCNLVPCLALFYYFPALLVEIDCSLIGNSQVDVHEGKFTLSVGWCWSCWKNAFCPSRKEVWLWFKTGII